MESQLRGKRRDGGREEVREGSRAKKRGGKVLTGRVDGNRLIC